MLHSLGANQSSEMTMQSVLAPHFVVITQCSPYQEVTGKSYHLKQHFLLPATAWRFTNEIGSFKKYASCAPIRSDQGNEWIDGKVLKYTQLFFLWAMHFWKKTLKTE